MGREDVVPHADAVATAPSFCSSALGKYGTRLMGARTGREYKEGLRDGREVYLGGKLVTDVVSHPVLRGGVESIAALYDMQHAPATRDVLTFESGSSGARTPMSYLHPRSVDDCQRRGRAFRTWAEGTGGLMGRSPDFLASAVVSFATAHDYFAEANADFAANVLRYHDECIERDLCLTHAIADPTVNQRRPDEPGDASVLLRIVDENDDGIVVRGAKMLATLAPYADEILVYPFIPLPPDAEDRTIAFAIPVATQGFKFVCREGLARDLNTFDHPLASRFDEMDAIAIFDDVLVPWDRVFLKGNVSHANELRARSDYVPLTLHQSCVRALVKCELVLGIATLMTSAVGKDSNPAVQEKLGEMVSFVEMFRACVHSAELKAERSPRGIVVPDVQPLQAMLIAYGPAYARFMELLQLVGSSGLIMTPCEGDLDGPVAAEISRYFQGAQVSAAERTSLFKLAADLALDSFGQRQVLYERFYAGDPAMIKARAFRDYDRRAITELVERFVVAPGQEPSDS